MHWTFCSLHSWDFVVYTVDEKLRQLNCVWFNNSSRLRPFSAQPSICITQRQHGVFFSQMKMTWPFEESFSTERITTISNVARAHEHSPYFIHAGFDFLRRTWNSMSVYMYVLLLKLTSWKSLCYVPSGYQDLTI